MLEVNSLLQVVCEKIETCEVGEVLCTSVNRIIYIQIVQGLKLLSHQASYFPCQDMEELLIYHYQLIGNVYNMFLLTSCKFPYHVITREGMKANDYNRLSCQQ